MKRDMELVREILLHIKGIEKPSVTKISFEDCSQDQVDHHLRLLEDAGLLKEHIRRPNLGGRAVGITLTYGHSITWEGHEFLDSIRDPEIWAKTKQGASQVGSWSVKLLADIAKAAVTAKAAELGIL